jgi:hypothetical protein
VLPLHQSPNWDANSTPPKAEVNHFRDVIRVIGETVGASATLSA